MVVLVALGWGSAAASAVAAGAVEGVEAGAGAGARSAFTPARALPKMGALGLSRGRDASAGADEAAGVVLGASALVERPPIRDAREATLGDSSR